jgi:hypothetical protein
MGPRVRGDDRHSRDTKHRMRVRRFVFAVTIFACGCTPTFADTSPPADCDEVTILDAGTYTIRHSKIGGLGVFHRLGGPVTSVLIWPSAKDSSEVLRMYLVPPAGLVCKSYPNDIVLNSISCSQSMPQPRLAVIVKFDAKVPPPYEMRMKNIVEYLNKEVLGCQMPPPSQNL